MHVVPREMQRSAACGPRGCGSAGRFLRQDSQERGSEDKAGPALRPCVQRAVVEDQEQEKIELEVVEETVRMTRHVNEDKLTVCKYSDFVTTLSDFHLSVLAFGSFFFRSFVFLLFLCLSSCAGPVHLTRCALQAARLRPAKSVSQQHSRDMRLAALLGGAALVRAGYVTVGMSE